MGKWIAVAGTALVLVAVLTLGLISVARTETLHREVSDLQGQLATQQREVTKIQGPTTGIDALSVEIASIQSSLDALKTSDGTNLAALQADVNLINQCVPEVQDELGNMTGSVDFNTGSVFVAPATQVSRFCSKFLFGGTQQGG